MEPQSKGSRNQPQSGHSIAWKWAAAVLGALLGVGTTIGWIAYEGLAERADYQLATGLFAKTLNYYSGSENIAPGDPMSLSDVAAALKRSGSPFSLRNGSIILNSPAPVAIQFDKGQISSIVDFTSQQRLAEFKLPPQLIINMAKQSRAKRIIVQYSDLPPVLIHAIVSAEDKRFFQHPGLDPLRIIKALYVDLREHRKDQGASTISMQLTRNLWLDRDKTWKRKIAEALITFHLEHRLTKEQIFEDYCNLVYLGGYGTFAINGFGEAAHVYFGKDVRQLNITETATLAGLIQRPSYYNPFRYPDRAVERRNVVLGLMRENEYMTDSQYREAIAAPLALRPDTSAGSQTQYFLDIARDEVYKDLDEQPLVGTANVYLTLDPRLEQAAEKAITDGMQFVDKILASRRKPGQPLGPHPQVALIALDPHTGEVKALCGGRDYQVSQLDRVFAKRPPGSIFKPFVYTAALNTAISRGSQVFTEATTVDDSPSTFQFGNASYSPGNFDNRFMGPVTLRQALAHSLNVATVKVAQMVGYDKVVEVARAAGLNDYIQPTPAVALGAYQVTPLEMARAYTIFANAGVRVQPVFVSAIQSGDGDELYRGAVEQRAALDPRVAFLMVDMLQEVMRSGTAAGVRARGFELPAAGKTGTSHDGWFAGFTSQLLCLVWVGFDDYSDLRLEGARSALPIWTEFMIEAARYKQYGDAKSFTAPDGVVRIASTDQAGSSNCPPPFSGYFIDGTEPPPVQCSPQDVQVVATADGGVTEESKPAQITPAPTNAPEPSITVERPTVPAETTTPP